MFKLGLRRHELRTYHHELTQHHSIRVRVHVLNLAHERLANLSDELLDGQVNIDADGEVTRSATLTYLDRRRTYDFSSDSPANGAVYADRMLRITYGVKVPALEEWVDFPIFTGPVVQLSRAGDEVTIECQGKELLALGQAWEPMTLKKGRPKVDAIRQIMRERGGEDHFDFPDLDARLPKAVTLGRQSQPWLVAQKIAESLNRQLYYDGRGVLRLRQHPENPVYTFRDGRLGGEVMTAPQVSFSTENVRNAVWVKGGKPKSKRKDDATPQDGDEKDKERGVRHFETAPRSHPLSPWRLGRDNAPRFLLEVIENQHVRSEKEARQLAQRVLRHRLRQLVDVSFDALPVPHLEPGDEVRIDTDAFAMDFPLRQASIPLKHDQLMSVGYHRQVSVARRRRHKK